MPVPYEEPTPNDLVGLPARSALFDRVSIYDTQEHALVQEQFHHEEALWRFGEYTIFVLMWTLADLNAGRTTRCTTCFTSNDITEVYNQPTKRRCPDCYGTTFEGGYRARIVRPGIWEASDTESDESRRGQINTGSATVQTTMDFHWHSGDYAIRADNSRWQVGSLQSELLDTGFEPSTARTALAYTVRATLEDPSSVAYDIPPTSPADVALLARRLDRAPHLFADIEDVRGPLLW